MNIKIQGLDELKASLGKYATQLPFAVSKAINETVAGAQHKAVQIMQVELHKPTPFIQRSVKSKKSTKRDLSARVWISNQDYSSGFFRGDDEAATPANILRPNIFGGSRIPKNSELRLRSNGWLRSDQYIVPGSGVRLDQYGNISAGQMQRIMGWIGAYTEAGYNRTAKTNHHFVIRNVGVFKRIGPGNPLPILIFVKRPVYAKRYHFFETVISYFNKNFSKNFAAALALAIKTAR